MNGMDDDEDETNFSDDEFAGLDDQDLLALEQDAIQSTQQMQPVKNEWYAPYLISSRGVWNGQASSQPRAAPLVNPYQNAARSGQFEDSHDETAYHDDGNVATPAEEKETFIAPRQTPSEMTQREKWRQQRYGKPMPQPVRRAPGQNVQQQPHQNYQQPRPEDTLLQERSMAIGPDDSMLMDDPMPIEQPQQVFAQEEGLRARLDDLLRERDELTKELHASKATLMTQKGEISVIRAKQADDSKVFDRQLTAMKKSLQDENARNKERIEVIKQESEKIATHNKFLKQELAEEAQKSKTLHRKLHERSTKPAIERPTALDNTPKKVHAHSLRDGFDDDEIVAISPVKSGGKKPKGGTPTGAKRKRKVFDASPVPALVLRQSGTSAPVEDKPTEVPKIEKTLPHVKKDRTAEKNLKFMQRILNHKSLGGRERVLEACIQYAFPAEPSQTFTSLLLAATARLPPSGRRFRAELLEVFVNLWASCLKQRYYNPVPLLLDVVCFITALESSILDEGVIKALLPVLQNCGKINAEPRFNHSPVRQRVGKLKQIPQSEINRDADGTLCLEILYDLASRCQNSDKLLDLFWRSMDTDFVLMMLNSSQPIADMTLMLNLLSTSILPTTFGNICSTPDEQAKMETYIIRRVCWLLWENPRVDEGLPLPTKSDICNLRLEVVNLLDVLVFTSMPHPHTSANGHGSKLLADHTDALARLVRSIYDEVDLMYLHRRAHQLHSQLVNREVNLLYHILQLHPTTNLPQKLSAVNGGVHKHRVVLTRLAFSEGVYLDAGISDECVGMARDMLEESVTPEEAEGLLEAFPEFARRVEPRGSQVEAVREETQDEIMKDQETIDLT